MKRKILTLVLMLTMVLSLVACNKLNMRNSSKKVLENMEKVTSNSLECDCIFDYDGQTLEVKIVGGYYDAESASFDVLLKYDSPAEFIVLEGYYPLTDIKVVNGKEYYINVTSILDCLSEIDPSAAMIKGYLGLSGDYFKITAAEIAKFMNENGDADIVFTEEDFVMQNFEKSGNVDEEFRNLLAQFIDELAEKTNKEAVSYTSDMISIKMNNDNYSTFIKGLASMDVEDYLMKFAERLDAVDDKSVGYTELMKDEIKGLNDEIKREAEGLETELVDSAEYNFSVDMGVKNKNLFVDIVAKVDSDDEAACITMNYRFSPDKIEEFEVPTSTFDLKEVYSIIGRLAGMFQ